MICGCFLLLFSQLSLFLPSSTMPQRCIGCQAELPENVKFCTSCGCDKLVDSVSAQSGFAAKQPAAPQPLSTGSQIPTQSSAASSSTFTAPLPAAAPLGPNTAKHAMDSREFGDLLGSLSRGLMKDRDQITKIKAAASAHFFTCDQASQLIAVVKGHPGEALVTLYPALVDASVENFSKTLLGMKWIEERQEVLTNLKLDQSQYAAVLKK